VPGNDVAQPRRKLFDAGECRTLQKPRPVQGFALREQGSHRFCDRRGLLIQLAEPGGAGMLVQLQRAIEIGLDIRPRQFLAVRRLHLAPPTPAFRHIAAGKYPAGRTTVQVRDPDLSRQTPQKRRGGRIVRGELAKPVANVWNRSLRGLSDST
jgi:hypothetical protein